MDQGTRTTSIIAVVIVVIILLVVVGMHSSNPGNGGTPARATVTYSCNTDKTITAVFSQGDSKPAASPDQPPTPGGSVALTLSDGRTMALAQTISADGARYANADESFVFWSKGNGALVLENNQQKFYIGCIRIASEATGQSLPQIYSNSSEGFSLRLPGNYKVDESYTYQELGHGKAINGIKFTIPESLATGTNLSPDSYVSVEEIPQTQSCSAALFLDRGMQVAAITEGDTTYSVASSTGAGAGNRYEETVYALPGTNPCIAVRYMVHYGVFENYPPGTVKQFDRDALLKQFDSIRKTLVVVQ